MFWIPGLSLLIFVLTMIPFIIYGYKKGWVYALVFSIVLWLVTLSFVGINYLIYKYLWKAYSTLILKNQTDVSLNLENLSKFYKTTIVLFATGMEFIFIYPITFFLMFFINKKIRKYSGHKLRNISKSEKEIIYRRNIGLSRISGISILTTSALFSSSLIASVFNVAFTPLKNSNIINSANDLIGKIYSLGFANNSKSAQIISDFIDKKLDKELAKSINELTNIKSNESKANKNIFPIKEQIQKLENNFKKFKDLFKNDEATKGVFLSIIKIEKQSINPLSFDNNTIRDNKDSNNDAIGYNKDDSNNIEAFENYVSNNKLIIKLPDSLKDLLTKMIEDSFIDFKNVLFARNYNNAKRTKNNHKNELEKRKIRKTNLNLDTKNRKTQRKKIVKWLENISGTTWDISSAFESNDPLNFPIDTIDRINLGTGNFQKEKDYEDKKQNIKQEKLKVKETKEKEYNLFFNGEYSQSKNIVEETNEDYKSWKMKLGELKKQLNKYKNYLKSNILSLIEQKKLIKKLVKEISELKKNVPFVGSINPIAKHKKDLANKIIASRKEVDRIELLIEKNKLDIDFETNEITKMEKITIPSAKVSWEKAKAAFVPLQKIEKTLKKENGEAMNEYNNSLKLYNDQQNKVNELKKEYDKTFVELTSKNTIISDNKISIDRLNNINNDFEFTKMEKWIINNKDLIIKDDGLIIKDDGSIFYQRNVIDFYEDKIKKLELISDRKKIIYWKIREKILLNYRAWLGE